MFFIPGQIIGALTFPGVIVHEAAHMFFCKVRNVAIFDVKFFQFADPAGYVIHENTDDFTSIFLISMGPFFINSILCFVICFPAFFPIYFFGLDHFLSYLLMWFGLSIGMHAIPSNQDARNIWDAAKKEMKKRNPLAIISFPIVVLINIFNVLRFFWSDLIYAAAIGIGIPILLFGI